MLEPGQSPRGSVKVAAPVALTKLFHSKWDWSWQSTPTEGTAHRPIHLARGKALGGSSAFNALLYHRGSADDFDSWGLPGWGSEDMLRHFVAQEANARADLRDSRYHGADGPLAVEDARYGNPLSTLFTEAARQAGYAENDDFNDWSRSQEGVGRFQITARRGRRAHAAATHLRAAIGRPNLHVETGARVTRVETDADGTATGVAFVDAAGTEQVARIAHERGGEVLLCAGAISTPQLLLLSGIGPSAELERHGLPVVADLPSVGASLADHPAVVTGYQIQRPIAITDQMFLARGLLSPVRVAQWLVRGSGPLATSGCDWGAFVKTGAGLSQPDLQLRFVAGLGTSPDGVSSYRDIGRAGRTPSGITLQSLAIRPHARGSVGLHSADPFEAPAVDIGYGTSEKDMRTLREGLRLSRRIVEQPAFDEMRGEESWPRLDLDDDDALDDYIRRTVHSGNALAGSCRMGREDDPSAAVTTELRVKGVGGLRVVDASILPRMPGGQLGATVFALADKAADMIIAGQQR